MNDSRIFMPWYKIGLGILPGICLLILQIPMSMKQPYIEVSLPVIALITFCVIGYNLWMYHHLEPWSWPILGVLSWSIWNVYRHSLYHRVYFAHILFVTYLVCVVIVVWGYWHFKMQVPQLGWVLIKILATTTAIIWGISGYFMLVVIGLLDLSYFLAPITLAYLLSKRYGLTATLFVAVFEPILIDSTYIPKYVLLQNNSSGDFATLVLTYLPILCFFIITPFGALRCNSVKQQLYWLLMPSLITIICTNLVRGLALVGTFYEYTLIDWIRYSFVVIQMWLLLPIAVSLNVTNQHPDSHSDPRTE